MPKINPIPPVEELNRRYGYNPATGALWHVRLKRRINKVNGKGYRYTTINGVHFKVARIIWKMMTGEDPVCIIDHENGDRLDDRWENLRDVTYKINANNKHGSSGGKDRNGNGARNRRVRERRTGSVQDGSPIQ